MEIFIVPQRTDLPEIVRQVLAKRRGDFQVGFVVYEGPTTGHVVPLLLARRPEGTAAALFDSKGRGGCSESILRSLKDIVTHLRWVEAHETGAQADHSSCHTDAMIVLKDALRRPDPIGDFESKLADVRGLPLYGPPAHLLKTAQRSRAVPDSMLTKVISLPEGHRQETLADHRARYTANVELEGPSAAAPRDPARVREVRSLNVYLFQKGKKYEARAESLRKELLGEGEAKLREVWDARVLAVAGPTTATSVD